MQTRAPAAPRTILLQFLLLTLILLTAGYFRFTGLIWDDYQYPHPDERFLIWVVADIAPVDTAAQYFDTANSSLNPVNRGHGFYVYGDFPVIATRYAAEALFEQVGWREILQVGRGLSALLDLLTVLLVYLIAERLINWKWATIAGLLSAAAVLQIQQAHFFTSDSFAVFFTTLAIYLGVRIASDPVDEARPGISRASLSRRILLLSLLYGAAVGMAMACKINTAPVALLLPLALGLRHLRAARARGADFWPTLADWGRLALYAVVGGAAAILVFRVAMPYAFAGPGFFGIALDERWLKNLNDLRAQSSGDVDFPPALQWARRNHLFSLQNLVLWGLGPALGIAGWVGFLAFAWQVFADLRVASKEHRGLRLAGEEGARIYPAHMGSLPAASGAPLTEAGVDASVPYLRWLTPAAAGTLLVFLWTGAYFLWQSLAWNPTMRYQLPIYPTLAFFAAWGLAYFGRKAVSFPSAGRWSRFARPAVIIAGVLVVGLTLAWAFAFTRIYTRTETRLAASQWIFENVPGPVNLVGQSGGEPWNMLLPVYTQARLRPGEPFRTQFQTVDSAFAGRTPDIAAYAAEHGGGWLAKVTLPNLRSTGPTGGGLRLTAKVYPSGRPDEVAAQGSLDLPASTALDAPELPLSAAHALEPGTRYTLELSLTSPTGDADPSAMLLLEGSITAALYGRVEAVPYTSETDGYTEVALPAGGTLRQVRAGSGAASSGDASYAASEVLLAPNGMLNVLSVDPETGQQLFGMLTAGVNGALAVDPPLVFEPGKRYLVTVMDAQTGMPVETKDAQPLWLDFMDEPSTQWFPAVAQAARPADPLWLSFSSSEAATIHEVTLGRAAQLESAQPTTLTVDVFSGRNPDQPLASGTAQIEGAQSGEQEVFVTFDRPLDLAPNETYNLTVTPSEGSLMVRGAAPANESTWDMALPFRVGSYDPYGGLYRGDLTLEMYWDDTPEKYERFVNILDQADYIFMSSNRQWGTTTRIPERYPLTTRFYHELMGCPAELDVITCYNEAEVGTYEGRLGFELAAVFTSYPNLGPLRFNDQYAEEAFTVYDHPKVLVFQKRPIYDPALPRQTLGAVDLSKVVHLTPRKAAEWNDLLLPAQRWVKQQAGGTFAALFPPEGLLNRFPGLAAVVWYLFFFALGAVTYPALRLALPGLADRGYPLARAMGMVVFAYLAWLPGSLGMTVSRGLLAGVCLAMLAAALLLVYRQRGDLRAEWRSDLKYFAAVEGLALGLFVLGLLLRLGNPDLWHPIFGGEKPMDFSYLNAVMKSSTFPPYDPWFAGGYINYYYYGFVLVGMPVKLLGIQPSVAYNLIMPMLFVMVGLGAFSVVYNLIAAGSAPEPTAATTPPLRRKAFTAGLVGVFALLLIGNLGIPRMYWQGFQKLSASDPEIASANLVQRLGYFVGGAGKVLRGEVQTLPFYPSDWYWKPSRAIQPESGQEITEFPFFTFLYGDLHAHLIALPVTILALGWALGVWLNRRKRSQHQRLRFSGAFVLAILLGALIAGALRPANTWDQYTFLALASVALFASLAFPAPRGSGWGHWLRALLPVIALVLLSLLLYYPFNYWFQQGYNTVEPWRGPKTNLASFLSHWGLFLFVVAGWLFQETVDWMAATPLSALARLRPRQGSLILAAAAVIVGIAALAFYGVTAALVIGPLGVWVTLLLLRPGQPAAKRAVLFAVGTALALALAVELVAVRGDIGRMNTVFKFYYQAWTLLSLSAAAAVSWLWSELEGWRPRSRSVYLGALALLAFSAALYPLHTLRPKFSDRLANEAPRTLDGMDYLRYARYTDGLTAENLREMDLSQDYRAIKWMQANVQGSPVIVEANTPEYRHWGTRYTIYTGLPGVVGWNWHQRQQRIVTPDTWIFDRIADVESFYTTTSPVEAADFLTEYGVEYIIFGQLERIWYPGPGLDKFAKLDGVLWDRVYEEGQTAIYRVRK